MNWMEFISSVVKSIVWPVAIIIIVIKLKRPVSNLISTLAKIKYKDWEFEFLINKKLDLVEFSLSNESSKETNVKDNPTSGVTIEVERPPRQGYVEMEVGTGKTNPFLRTIRNDLYRLDSAIIDLYYTVKSRKNETPQKASIGKIIGYLVSEDIIEDKLGEAILLLRQTPDELETVSVIPESIIDRARKYIKTLTKYFNSKNELLAANTKSSE
ncbi:hypothetical protein AAHT65_07610 [Bacillus atrophaeus]